jgi:hypothetical protein
MRTKQIISGKRCQNHSVPGPDYRH